MNFNKGALWTSEETSLLLQWYNVLPNEELYLKFPEKSPIAIYKKARRLGLRKAPEIEFVNRSLAKKGEKCNLWKGGVLVTKKGYRLIKMPDHHRADSHGYVLEHILVFESECGTTVPDRCCIHHLNGIKDDNRIENLCMMTRSAHTAHHNTGSKRSDQTREKISAKAKCRYRDQSQHPMYKQVDIDALKADKASGMSVKDICTKYNIGKFVYYNRMYGKGEKNEF